MNPVMCPVDTKGQRNLISKDFTSSAYLAKISKNVRPSLLFVLKYSLKTKRNINSQIRINDLTASVLFTVVKNLTIGVLLGTFFIEEHILGILPDEQEVTAGK